MRKVIKAIIIISGLGLTILVYIPPIYWVLNRDLTLTEISLKFWYLTPVPAILLLIVFLGFKYLDKTERSEL